MWYKIFFWMILLSSTFSLEPYLFKEVWAYVMRGEEKFFDPKFPVTDVGYFCARLDDTGKLGEAPNFAFLKQKVQKGTKIHCVITADYNRSLMYWCLKKDLETKNHLVQEIVDLAKEFDGIQIDFESIRPEEREAFSLFLKEIKEKMPPKKIFSVALPARIKLMQDGYDYEAAGRYADKVLVMGYDEHYGGGPAGTIASLQWHQKIYQFAKEKIPEEKLIMALPFYGRVWQKQVVARALKYFQTLYLWKEKNSPLVQREKDDTPYFTYQENIDAIIYFEDLKSLQTKLAWYEKAGLVSVGFWRISQEPASLWKHIAISRAKEKK